MKTRQKGFWRRFDRFPPVMVRLLAKAGNMRALTNRQIADDSGLPVGVVVSLSMSTSWDGVDIPTAMKFLRGCRVDFSDAKQMKRVENYVRTTMRWTHIKFSPEKEFLMDLVSIWQKHTARR